ncbi:MAG TPA: vanadium-dependent haloperoxidase [Chitinophagaceae bacterium]|nr:vanadium-dependent haloperoxidase [Chitinophagaceae bacterium]
MKKIFFLTGMVMLLLTACHKNYPGYPGTVKSDSKLLTGWIGLHLQMIRNTTGVTHIAYSRHFSYTGVALYESLVGGMPGYKSVASKLNGNLVVPVEPKGVKIFHPAAANASIASMLRFFYSTNINNVEAVDSLEGAYFTAFEKTIGDKFDLDASVEYGKSIAASVIEWSKQDGAGQANIAYTPLGEGYWEPTPNGFAGANMPGWGNNRLLVSGSNTGTMPDGLIPFSKEPGSGFYQMVKEVLDVSKVLTPDQKAIALFWDDAPNGQYVSVFGHWFSVLKQVLEKEKTSLPDGAVAYLRLGVAMNDATITCWQTKYQYHTIRPVTYIRKYMGETAWLPLISTPPHPEYASAHSTISASGVYALESVFGNNYAFSDHTYDGIGMSRRNFNSFDHAAKEAGQSRFYAGIHYQPSIEAGYAQGRKVGANVVSRLRTR